jgi:hypothetical protein
MNRRAVLFAVAGCLALTGCVPERTAELRRQVPWAFGGTRLVVDLHSHSQFSGGALTIEDLVWKATDGGCNALALADHAGPTGSMGTATPEFFAALRRARVAHPDLLLIAGVGWGASAHHGPAHVNVLVAPALEEGLLGALVAALGEVAGREGGPPAGPDDALEWLGRAVSPGDDVVLFYSHPSAADGREEETEVEPAQWQADSRFTGFEGAPGHQRRIAAVGASEAAVQTQDRWDPAVARIGGVWDRILDGGVDVWGALANSDYHDDRLDYAPCEFSRTHVTAPDRSVRGVLRGLRAGSFWADHGQILNLLQFRVGAPGLDLPATPGEAIAVSEGTSITASVVVERRWGAGEDPLVAELIGSCATGDPGLVGSTVLAPGDRWASWTLSKLKAGRDGESCFLRARVRKRSADGPHLMAYANPVRIHLQP